MEKQWIRRGLFGLVSLVVLTSAGLFLFKDVILRHVADRKIAEISAKYKLNITYAQLTMPALSAVRLQGLTVVPQDRDTLFTLHELEVGIDFPALLAGKISIRRVDADEMKLVFSKHGSASNYDFLFRPASARPKTETANRSGEYASRIDRAFGLLLRLIPENGDLHGLTVIGRRDSLETSFFIPALSIRDSRFASCVEISEGDLNNTWNIRASLDRASRNLAGSISSLRPEHRVILPYIRPHYHAAVGFDSVAFSLSCVPSDKGRQAISGKASVDGLEIFHTALSPDTISLDQGEFAYNIYAGDRYLELDSTSTVLFNRLKFHPYLRIEKKKRWHVTASVRQSSFPAQDLFASLPAGLFRHVQGIRAEGALSYDFLLDVDFNALDSLRFFSELKGHGFRLLDLGSSELSKMSSEFEYTAFENDLPVRTFPVGPSCPSFRPLSQISPWLQNAVLQSEDGSFFYHDGFYPGAIREALSYDLKVGRFARGGSSITMQLVKNVFLNRHKNIARKLEESLMVWLIESQHLTSKERMYEVYLNIAEWGPLIYGAAEAARFYFDKEPAELTASEAIFLASIIPKPKHFRSVFNADGTLRDNQLGYYRLLARRLAVKGLMTEAEAEVFVPRVEVKGAARDYIISSDSLPASSPMLPHLE